MNALFNKKDLVKTSSKPWKTKTANIFIMNNKYYFTDLPGYWFAKLGKEVLEKLDALISWYLEARKNYIKTVCILIDTKIWLQQKDIEMFNYVQSLEIPVIIVLSKTDRLWKSEVLKAKNYIEKELFGQKVIITSSTKKVGIKELFKELSDRLIEK
jgi:GTP-binding protein